MSVPVLEQLGLPKNEARIYLSLLGSGALNVSAISNKAKVNRRNVYDSLKNLQKRKLVSLVRSEKENTYTAVDPRQLKAIITQQQDQVASLVPELHELYKAHEAVEQAFVARGMEAVKNYWRYVGMQKNTTTYFIGGKGLWHDPEINTERSQMVGQWSKRGIITKGIFDYEVSEWGGEVYSEYDKSMIRFFPKEYSTKANIDICNDRIFVTPMKGNLQADVSVAFTLVSQSLADSYRTWFEFMWERAKKLEEIEKM